MEQNGERENVIMAVIRGESTLDDLRTIGIKIRSSDGGYELSSPNPHFLVAPTVRDVAHGILKYGSKPSDNDEIKRWAFFILAESGMIDLRELESDPNGELLISALWNASFDGRFDDKTMAAARGITLALGSGKSHGN